MAHIDPCYGGGLPCYPMIGSNNSQNNSLPVQVSQSKSLMSFCCHFHRLGTTMSRKTTSTLVVANQNSHMLPTSCSSFSSISIISMIRGEGRMHACRLCSAEKG